MKRCPTCNRTYADETLTFCLADGSLLSASYDPEATQVILNPGDSDPIRSEALPSRHDQVKGRSSKAWVIPVVVVLLLACAASTYMTGLLSSRKTAPQYLSIGDGWQRFEPELGVYFRITPIDGEISRASGDDKVLRKQII
jgi:hypothetical protein